MTQRSPCCTLLVLACSLFLAASTVAQDRSGLGGANMVASGTFAPAGPPREQPVRVNTGGGCVVDLVQTYTISGTLSGTLEVDYRILVHGPCEVPPVPGRYDEEWIAFGTFTGTVDSVSAACSLTYTATVRAGGDVEGRFVLGSGLEGELSVTGSFADGTLSYRGSLN